MKNGKERGPDGITVEALKRAVKEIHNMLLGIFNICLIEKIFFQKMKSDPPHL